MNIRCRKLCTCCWSTNVLGFKIVPSSKGAMEENDANGDNESPALMTLRWSSFCGCFVHNPPGSGDRHNKTNPYLNNSTNFARLLIFPSCVRAREAGKRLVCAGQSTHSQSGGSGVTFAPSRDEAVVWHLRNQPLSFHNVLALGIV